jgi:hypothetical protein
VSTSVDPTPSELDVAQNRPAACWSVQEGDWSGKLPAELAALLAPPVTVFAEPVAPSGGPVARRDGRPAGFEPRRATRPDHAARVLTAVAPRRNRRPVRAAPPERSVC